MKYYIGIDGGGTKTEGVLTDASGRVLAKAFGSASNPNDVTPEGSLRVLREIVDRLMADSGLTEHDLPATVIFGGIAGGINHGPTLEALLKDAYPTAGGIRVRSDVQIMLSGQLPEGDGACIICGTGSVCFLRRGEELIRIGGWGYLLDSGGSGYDLGRDALEAVLRAHDGRGEPTRLTELLSARLGGEVHTRITEIYREGKPYIASCAPCVFDAAEQGDPVALAILRRNARVLAEYVETAWSWLCRDGKTPPACLPVVMGGGISSARSETWLPLVQSLTDPDIPLRIVTPATRLVFGAVVEAAKLADPAWCVENFPALQAAFAESYAP